MAIKVTETPTLKKRTYPIVVRCVKHPDLIVLMCKEGTGVCLAPKDHPNYGVFNPEWFKDPQEWTPTCVTIDSFGEF